MVVKKVLYIFNDDGFGGAGQSLLDMLIGIRKWITPVVVIRDDAPVEEKFKEVGIQCHRIRFSTDFVKIGTGDDRQRACKLLCSDRRTDDGNSLCLAYTRPVRGTVWM